MAPYTYSHDDRYNQIGSHANQPQGYSSAIPSQQLQQQQPASTLQYQNQTPSAYQANYNTGYNETYPSQQYATSRQQQSISDRASSAVKSITNPSYSPPTSHGRSSNVTAQYDNAYYGSAGFSAINDRSQPANTSQYATTSVGSTFGRLSLPDQPQVNSNTFTNRQTYPQSSTLNASTSRGNQMTPTDAPRGLDSYSNTYVIQQISQQQPQRYASPLSTVRGHSQVKDVPSRSNSTISAQIAAHNAQQHSDREHHNVTLAEPSHATVDPSQVYDMRAEQQRKAQAEAEKRRMAEMARMAEEEARAAETARMKAEEDRKAAEALEAKRLAREAQEEAKKKAAQERRNEQRRKAREENRKSKTAATALTQMASSSGMNEISAMMGDMSGPPANDEEAEMRAMFKKMREFNARNPAMLAKLWEEERTQHAARSAPLPQPAKSTQRAQTPIMQPPKQPVPVRSAGTTPSSDTAAPAVAQDIANSRQPYNPKTTPTTQPPAPLVTQQATTTLWPPHKKVTLAETAVKWLNSLPENAKFGRTIEKDNLLKILDTNPSYVQLCESIEKTKIRFERSALAKELLKAVPDGLRGNQTVNKTPTSGTSITALAPESNVVASSANSGNEKNKRKPTKNGPLSYGVPPQERNGMDLGPVSYQAPEFPGTADVMQDMDNVNTIPSFPQGPGTVASAITAGALAQKSLQSPRFIQGFPITNVSHATPQQQPKVTTQGPTHPEPSPRPPADKEEAARKRTFGDLVDLTAQEDSDEEGPPRKMQQLSSGLVNGFIKCATADDDYPNLMDSTEQQQHKHPIATIGTGLMHASMAHTQPFVFNSHFQPPLSVVPSQRPPPPPPLPPPRPKGSSEELKQQERMRGKMLVEPIMRDRVARKSKYDSRTIARDVLLATGRHPDMRPLNAHLNSMQKLLGDHGGAFDGAGNKSDLSTIRWDIIDPGEPREHSKARSNMIGTLDAEGKGVTVRDTETGLYPQLATKDVGKLSRSTQAQILHISEEKMQELKDIARPGEFERINEDSMRRRLVNRLYKRHWKRQNHDSPGFNVGSASAGHAAAAEGDISITGPGRQRNYDSDASGMQALSGSVAKPKRGRPRKSSVNATSTPTNHSKQSFPHSNASMTSGGAVGYSAFRQYDEDGNVIKKKGRPVGWRKNVHSREAAGLTPYKSGANVAKAVPTRPHPPPSEQIVQPTYQVYACQWQNCSAQLDNLDRLKKHLLKLHGTVSSDYSFQCQWKPCRLANDESFASFETLEQWMNHVNGEHIESVAWKLGDGPKGGTVSDLRNDPDQYLWNAHSETITPVIFALTEGQARNQGRENATTITKSELLPFKRIGRPPKEPVYRADGSVMTKEERDAAAALDKLRKQKLHEGISMGREGSTLANEKRRLGFLDDEDFEDIISDSDPEGATLG